MAYSLDDSWDNCTPVARAGNACFGLYVRCGIWSARNLTDGFVPGEIAAGYGSPEQTRKLVDVGLWEAAEGGYQDLHYLLRNKPAERVEARRQAEAERKARWREQARRKHGTQDKTRTSGGTHAGTPRGVLAPVPPPKGGKGAGAHARPTPHPYSDDGTGTCLDCLLPYTNTVHAVGEAS